MANYCELCGKQTVAGRRIQHHHSIQWRFRAPRTTRKFRPNLRKVSLMDANGTATKATVCMKCYKRLRKEEKVVEHVSE